MPVCGHGWKWLRSLRAYQTFFRPSPQSQLPRPPGLTHDIQEQRSLLISGNEDTDVTFLGKEGARGPAAVGAAVAVALWGHWDHERLCRWPHKHYANPAFMAGPGRPSRTLIIRFRPRQRAGMRGQQACCEERRSFIRRRRKSGTAEAANRRSATGNRQREVVT